MRAAELEVGVAGCLPTMPPLHKLSERNDVTASHTEIELKDSPKVVVELPNLAMLKLRKPYGWLNMIETWTSDLVVAAGAWLLLRRSQ